jgi:hypothetical protein
MLDCLAEMGPMDEIAIEASRSRSSAVNTIIGSDGNSEWHDACSLLILKVKHFSWGSEMQKQMRMAIFTFSVVSDVKCSLSPFQLLKLYYH